MKVCFFIFLSMFCSFLLAQESADNDIYSEQNIPVEDIIDHGIKIQSLSGISVGNQAWFNNSIVILSSLKDQIVLPENNLFYNNISAIDIYRARGWDEFQYSYIRKVSLEIERREDNKDW